jgi:hypothetical protein
MFVRTCYDYFKSIEGMADFGKIPIPETEYQTNLKELSRTPIEQWLESYTRDNFDNEGDIELSGNDAFHYFKVWSHANNIDYKITPQKLGVKISNLNISGIEKGNHTREGKTKIYNIPKLKKHFAIGCLVAYKSVIQDEIEEEED